MAHYVEPDRDSQEAAVLVGEFLERDRIPGAVAEEVARQHAAGNHREALQLILEARGARRSR